MKKEKVEVERESFSSFKKKKTIKHTSFSRKEFSRSLSSEFGDHRDETVRVTFVSSGSIGSRRAQRARPCCCRSVDAFVVVVV